MKLEIKHLAAYLPYRLSMIFEKSGRLITMQSCFYNGNIHITDANEGNCYDLSIWNFKPILRPLSDLTKEIEHNGERFLPIDELWEQTLEEINSNTYDDYFFNQDLKTTWICKENILQLEYVVVDKLFEWHFDVFGLIDAGLAIDINTLNN